MEPNTGSRQCERSNNGGAREKTTTAGQQQLEQGPERLRAEHARVVSLREEEGRQLDLLELRRDRSFADHRVVAGLVRRRRLRTLRQRPDIPLSRPVESTRVLGVDARVSVDEHWQAECGLLDEAREELRPSVLVGVVQRCAEPAVVEPHPRRVGEGCEHFCVSQQAAARLRREGPRPEVVHHCSQQRSRSRQQSHLSLTVAEHSLEKMGALPLAFSTAATCGRNCSMISASAFR